MQSRNEANKTPKSNEVPLSFEVTYNKVDHKIKVGNSGLYFYLKKENGIVYLEQHFTPEGRTSSHTSQDMIKYSLIYASAFLEFLKYFSDPNLKTFDEINFGPRYFIKGQTNEINSNYRKKLFGTNLYNSYIDPKYPFTYFNQFYEMDITQLIIQAKNRYYANNRLDSPQDLDDSFYLPQHSNSIDESNNLLKRLERFYEQTTKKSYNMKPNTYGG